MPSFVHSDIEDNQHVKEILVGRYFYVKITGLYAIILVLFYLGCFLLLDAISISTVSFPIALCQCVRLCQWSFVVDSPVVRDIFEF